MLFDASRIQNNYAACGYTDVRKQIDGLTAIVELQYKWSSARKAYFCSAEGRRTESALCFQSALAGRRFRPTFPRSLTTIAAGSFPRIGMTTRKRRLWRTPSTRPFSSSASRTLSTWTMHAVHLQGAQGRFGAAQHPHPALPALRRAVKGKD